MFNCKSDEVLFVRERLSGVFKKKYYAETLVGEYYIGSCYSGCYIPEEELKALEGLSKSDAMGELDKIVQKRMQMQGLTYISIYDR